MERTRTLNARQKSHKNSSYQIMFFIFLAILIGCSAILSLVIQISRLEVDYNKSMELNYQDISYMDRVESLLYQHESYIYQHLSTESTAVRNEIQLQAETVETEILEELNALGEAIKDKEYASYYQKIHSEVSLYFQNVSISFGFNIKNDIQNAEYYLNTTVNPSIRKVNETINELRGLIYAQMEEARSITKKQISATRRRSTMLLGILLLVGILGEWNSGILMHHMVNNDPLTELANEHTFLSFVHKLKRTRKMNMYTAAFLNLKNFRYINHLVGNQGGNQAIAYYGEQLRNFLIKGEKACRLGGDNFIVLFYKHRQKDFLDCISNIEVSISDKSDIHNLKLNARCGLYSLQDDDEISAVLNKTSIALNHAREKSTSDFVWFQPAIAQSFYQEKEIIYHFKEALKNGDFKIYYQPKVNIEQHAMVGCEALVRWERPDRLVLPMEFIPALEKNGLISELDFYVFEQICKDICRWISIGLPCVPVSSNFSKQNLANPDFAQKIIEIISKYQLDRNLLELEMTESTNRQDYELLKTFLAEMTASRVSTVIDDFGIGYSSLELLKNPHVKVIKLDKTFIDNIEVNNGSNAHEMLVTNIIHTCFDMKKQIICEGVENEEQEKLLKEMNCKVIQGYLYDKPLCREAFERRLFHPIYTKED